MYTPYGDCQVRATAAGDKTWARMTEIPPAVIVPDGMVTDTIGHMFARAVMAADKQQVEHTRQHVADCTLKLHQF